MSHSSLDVTSESVSSLRLASKNFVLYYQNVRGLNSKLQNIRLSTISAPYDCIALSETWLSESVLDGEVLDLDAYNLFRCDRNFSACGNRRGGDVLLAVRRTIRAVCLHINDLDDFRMPEHVDILLVRIFLDSCSVIICLVYIPPACRIDDYIVLFDSLMATDMLFDNNLLIIGDFNMPDFLTLSQSRCYASTSSIYTHFSRFLNFFNMRQFNKIVNSIGRLLDLVVCNKSCRVAKADDVLVPEDNYHPALEITTSWTEDTHSFPTFSSLNYNFRKADFYSLYRVVPI
jgi:hypothetical protein